MTLKANNKFHFTGLKTNSNIQKAVLTKKRDRERKKLTI